MIKKNIENEDEDYIIDNDQEIEDFEDNNNYNNNIKNKISIPKEQNKSNKSPKISYRSGGEWVKEAKEKYKQEKIKLIIFPKQNREFQIIKKLIKKL